MLFNGGNKGSANYIEIIKKDGKIKKISNVNGLILNKDDSFFVNLKQWHQIKNSNDEICKIIEIQFGERTSEEDIERIEN